MSGRQSKIIAGAVFCTFVLLNIFVIYSMLHSTSNYAAAGKDSISDTLSEDEIYEKYNHKYIPPSYLIKPEAVKYVVKDGDTLWDISSTFKIDVTSIIASNNLQSPDSLKIGQELIIPSSSNSAGTSSTESNSVKLAARSASAPSQSFAGYLPVSGRISSRFGYRGGEFHKGLDIAAGTGTDVHAFADGEVVFSGWDNGGYGYLVIVAHNNGYETYYAHNSKLIVKAGQTVTRGQVISKVGNTGNSDGSHCHFEIRRKGSPVNPIEYLK